jgi:hypothetical protein
MRQTRLGKRIRHGLSDLWYLRNARFGWPPGIKSAPGKNPVIVSLTTIPERLPTVIFTIESLMQQASQPDRLILWLNEKLGDKIPALLRRQTRRGLEIRLADDIGPHGKLIHALKEFPGCTIVTADDDTIYPRFWLGELLAAHEREPQAVTCHRAHRMLTDQAGKLLPYRQWDWSSPGCTGPSLWLFPTGVSGVLYPPHALSPEVFNRDVFQRICPTADDIWLKAMSLLNNVRCQKAAPFSTEWPLIPGTQHKNLSAVNVENGQNDVQLRAVFDHYNLDSRLNTEDFQLLSPRNVI